MPTITAIPSTMFSSTAFPRVFSAAVLLPSPRRIEIRAAAPTPTIAPKAEAMFIIGIVIAMPAIAAPPTPCPTKMLSIMWYSDDDAIAMMAGIAYRKRSLPMLSVPSDNVEDLVLINLRKDSANRANRQNLAPLTTFKDLKSTSLPSLQYPPRDRICASRFLRCRESCRGFRRCRSLRRLCGCPTAG